MPELHNRTHHTAPPDAVYIGRGSRWGNPFVIGPDGGRDQVIARYVAEVLPGLNLEPLRGRDLVCFCYPKHCHGDAIFEALYGHKAPRPDAANRTPPLP